jgi:hypothetical protein
MQGGQQIGCGSIAHCWLLGQDLQISARIVAIRKEDSVLTRALVLLGKHLLEENDVGFQGRLISRTVVSAPNGQEVIGCLQRLLTAQADDAGNETTQ